MIYCQFNGFQVFVSVKDVSIIRKKKEIEFFRAKMNIIYVKYDKNQEPIKFDRLLQKSKLIIVL